VEAEKLEAQVIETRRTVLGLEHPDTLASMANLASIYCIRSDGKRREAERASDGDIQDSIGTRASFHPDQQGQPRWEPWSGRKHEKEETGKMRGCP
jgi:Tetratricopeptide repeat